MAWSIVLDVMPTTLLSLGIKVSSSKTSPPFLSSKVSRGIIYSPVHVAVQAGYWIALV